ncbi:hypothetical protein BGW36DRAFT_386617 [Talaromyces proteolyticus]|uniref:TauD/TfdA-like domain-containing protein n=1 Tax=Talaromyces proteolyticus TaxID=1131652 RepID=A0AAD4KNC4_9EURO|nr:uncharacterized protein BGW36DRAFT_386617 [Talaromyces proteolyticus]KAH8691955.1 hypothetical protein BGW36DRAFT_386617 [Talaromyces proteolyticus]
MHRPGVLLLRSSRWPAGRTISLQAASPARRWFSEKRSLSNSSAKAARGASKSTEATSPGHTDVGETPIPRLISTDTFGHSDAPSDAPRFKTRTGPHPKSQADLTSIEEWKKEQSKLTFRGTVKELGQSQASVRVPWTKKTREKHRVTNVYYVQLRDGCDCPLCVDPKTKQRYFRTSDIPSKIKPRQMRWIDESWVDEEKVLEILWDNDVPGYDSSHVTRVTADEIRFPASFHYNKETHGRPRVFWNKAGMDEAQHWISYKDYIENDAKFGKALRALARYGLIFIKDIPESREMVEKIATRIGPLRNSFYGSTWDVRNDPHAKNVAYTNQNLGFHMDLLYMTNPPGFQLLHCLKNSCQGGESLFLDAFSAANDLDTSSWDILTRFQVPYHYNHDDHYYRTSRPVIETANYTTTLDSLENRWIAHINYSPPFQGPFRISSANMKRWGIRAESFINAFKTFADKIEDPERIFELKLNPGECVIFENRRVLHARRAFDTTSGERWLAGAYVDEDAVNSKMFTWKRKAGVFEGNAWESDT